MSTQDLALFKALSARMDYLNQRQAVISQNVANADTPGYQPHDLTKVDFSTMLKDVTGDTSVKVATTNPQHMPNALTQVDTKEKNQKKVYEVAPAGNSVIMEEQLFNSSRNSMDYALMLNVYQKNVGMIRTALGR